MARQSARIKSVPKPVEPLKLDFGCGPHKREGFQGVDAIAFVGVDFVVDLVWRNPGIPTLIHPMTDKAAVTLPSGFVQWPWADNSVGEAHASHFVEHLTGWERVHFVNELYRVLIPGGTCQIITPHWASCRAYGDPTHQWPPVSEFWFLYLEKAWRDANAPHTDQQHEPRGFNCNFNWGYGYSYKQDAEFMGRNEEFKRFALQNYKEAAADTIATITAVK